MYGFENLSIGIKISFMYSGKELIFPLLYMLWDGWLHSEIIDFVNKTLLFHNFCWQKVQYYMQVRYKKLILLDFIERKYLRKEHRQAEPFLGEF